MRRATAYSNSCSQVVLDYLHPLRILKLESPWQSVVKIVWF